LVGIFSERDAVRALATNGAKALEATVSELMSTDVQTCDETTTVTELMGLMTSDAYATCQSCTKDNSSA